jgi:hypothetical protein
MPPCSALPAAEPYCQGKRDWNANKDVQPGYVLRGYLSKTWTRNTVLYRGYQEDVVSKPEMPDEGSSVLTDAGYNNI